LDGHLEDWLVKGSTGGFRYGDDEVSVRAQQPDDGEVAALVRWVSRLMHALVALSDKEALYGILDRSDE
jgi:hypothetical protein